MRKIKRIAVSSIVGILFSLLPSQVPSAFAGVADCITISTPTASLSSTSLTISGSGTVNCTAAQLGSAGNPVLSVVGEGYSAQCSGFYKISPGAYNSFTCTIPIGGFSGSTRYGATSTQIKLWFAWDFSTKFITISHSAIPSKPAPVVTPVPTQVPVPTQSISPNTLPTQSSKPMEVLQYCTKGTTTSKWVCAQAPFWGYVICSGLSKANVEILKGSKWVRVKSFKAPKDSKTCGTKTPYVAEYIGQEDLSIGTHKYRFNFPAQMGYTGFKENFIVLSVLSEVGKNAR